MSICNTCRGIYYEKCYGGWVMEKWLLGKRRLAGKSVKMGENCIIDRTKMPYTHSWVIN